MDFTISRNQNRYPRHSVFRAIERTFCPILSSFHRGRSQETSPFIRPLEGNDDRKFGDYVCLDAFDICEELEEEYANPGVIASEIADKLKRVNTDIISKDSIQFHNIGTVTFSLHETFLAKMVEKMVSDGINTFAPVISKSKTRAVFLSRRNTTFAAADMLQADFIKQALSRIFLYSGIDIHDVGVSQPESISSELKIIEKYGRVNKVDIIVYMISHLDREEMLPLFTADRSEDYQAAALVLCGYRSFIRNPEKELYCLWKHYLDLHPSVFKLVENAGYSKEGFFVCAVKFSLLKSHRLAQHVFDIGEIHEKGSLLYVLGSRDLICSVLKKNSHVTSLLESEQGALAGKEERALAFHIVQFTAVIEEACAGVVPNVVCDYLCSLSELFTNYHNMAQHGKDPILGLCKAAEMVMGKCFGLLGITQENREGLEVLVNVIRKGELGMVKTIPSVELGPCRGLAEARCKYLKSRLEIFSMTVDVVDLGEFDTFGTVSVIDAFEERPDGWTMSDTKDCCFVTCFECEWHNPLDTLNGACIPFGDPSCRRSVPVSPFIEVHVLVQVSSKDREKYYKVCYVPGHVQDFSDFWAGEKKVKTGTLQFKSDAGLVGLNYAILKEAVEASMELTFSPTANTTLEVNSKIMAHYGDDVVVDDGGILGQLKAVLFESQELKQEENQAQLKMYKSRVAVPVGSCLIIVANLVHPKTNKAIFDHRREYSATPGNVDNWLMEFKGGSLNLRVTWSDA